MRGGWISVIEWLTAEMEPAASGLATVSVRLPCPSGMDATLWPWLLSELLNLGSGEVRLRIVS
jgi:hypothetical protein